MNQIPLHFRSKSKRKENIYHFSHAFWKACSCIQLQVACVCTLTKSWQWLAETTHRSLRPRYHLVGVMVCEAINIVQPIPECTEDIKNLNSF